MNHILWAAAGARVVALTVADASPLAAVIGTTPGQPTADPPANYGKTERTP